MFRYSILPAVKIVTTAHLCKRPVGAIWLPSLKWLRYALLNKDQMRFMKAQAETSAMHKNIGISILDFLNHTAEF